MKKLASLVGETFNQLTVDRLVESIDSERRWVCICTCGKTTKPITSYNLKSGHTKSCGCLKSRGLESKSGYEKLYTGFEDLSSTYWCVVKHNAKIRDIEFKITIEDAWNQFIKQSKKCALSGESIILDKRYGTNSKSGALEYRKQTASLDRIDSSKGYTTDNIQWVHKTVQQMKMSIEDKTLIEWCKKVANNN